MEIEGTARILVWFAAPDVKFLNPAMDVLQRQFGNLEVVGMTGEKNFDVTDAENKSVPFIPLTELSGNGGGYDILLVAGSHGKLSGVLKRAKELNIDSDKIWGDKIVSLPGFTFEKYRELQRSKVSIFSQNCFGGFLSNTLGLRFLSPFVNLACSSDDFIKILKQPRSYMEEEIIYKKLGWDPNLQDYYPAGSLGDTEIHFIHYPDFDEAVRKWNKRKLRINWHNLFVMMCTEDPEILKKFDELPYEKKVCFVPFKSNLDSAFYINLKKCGDSPLWKLVNGIGIGNVPIYDVFDMLLYGKKTQFVDM